MALRIVLVHSGREWRAAPRQLLLLAQGLREDGHEPLVIAPPDSPLLTRLRTRGLAAAAVRMRGPWDLAAARRMRTLLTTWRADLVHAHDAPAYGLAALALVRRPGVPLLVTRHGAVVHRGWRAYGERETHVLAGSNAVAESLRRSGVDADLITVVPAGVEEPPVSAARDWHAERGWPADTVVCGLVGARAAGAWLPPLIDAATRLPPDIRARARLILLGGQAAGTGTLGGVTAFRAGFVDEVHAAIAGLDVLLHISPGQGFPLGVAEAMIRGVPPVGVAVGGMTDLVENGRSGLIVPPGDAVAFAQAAARLIGDAELRRTLASGAVARAREFGVRRMVVATEGAYREALERLRAPS